MIKIICKNCKRPFLGRNNAKFCSRDCWKKFGPSPSVKLLSLMNRAAFHPERLTGDEPVISIGFNGSILAGTIIHLPSNCVLLFTSEKKPSKEIDKR